MRAPRTLVLILTLLLLGVGPAQADDPGPRPKRPVEDGSLSLERLFAGRSMTTPIPRWSWRPNHSQLVRVVTQPVKGPRRPGPDGGPTRTPPPPPRRLLVAMDPETGAQQILLSLGALDPLVSGKGTRFRGIGRAGPPSYRFAESGKSLCAVVKGDLVWVDLEAPAYRRLTRTKSPMSDLRIAPDGRHVSFSRANELWVTPTDGSFELRKLTEGGSEEIRNSSLDWVYPEEFGFSTGAWWAPDSAHIAYLQLDERKVPQYRLPKMLDNRGEGRVMRYPKVGDPNPVARVGVVPVSGGPTTWLDLGDPEYVVRVAWTPDASRVLVVTLDRKQQHLKLLSADPTTGASMVVLEEQDDCWIDAPPAPRFLDRRPRTFLWRSHVDGSRRWWLVTLSRDYTEVVRESPLTPADMQAGRILHVDPAQRTAYFTGTPHGSSLSTVYAGWGGTEQDVWSKSAPFVASDGLGIGASLDHTGRYALVTRSDPLTPPRTELLRVPSGERLAVIGDARSAATVKTLPARVDDLQIPAEAGGVIRMRLWLPADLDAQLEQNPDLALPMIVNVYAGPGSQMVKHTWGRGPYFQTLLTRKGYAVLQIDGRGTAAQGAAFTRRVYGRCGVVELADQVRGVQHVSKRRYIDAKRVGIWGWSYGGTMTCNALTMRSDVFKVGVSVAPVTDWRYYDTIYTERYMGLVTENKQGYETTASWRHAKSMNGHLLILHGMGDDNVHAQSSFKLSEELLRHGKRSFSMMAYPWRGHGIQGVGLDVFTRVVGWFDTHL